SLRAERESRDLAFAIAVTNSRSIATRSVARLPRAARDDNSISFASARLKSCPDTNLSLPNPLIGHGVQQIRHKIHAHVGQPNCKNASFNQVIVAIRD